MTDTSKLLAEIEQAVASGVGDPWEMLGRATRALATASEKAWEKGYARGAMDHCDYSPTDECDISSANPYRKASA